MKVGKLYLSAHEPYVTLVYTFHMQFSCFQCCLLYFSCQMNACIHEHWFLVKKSVQTLAARPRIRVPREMHMSSVPFQSNIVSDTNFARNIIYFLKARQSNPMPSSCQEIYSTFPTFEMWRSRWESKTTVPGRGGGQAAEGPRGSWMAVAREQRRARKSCPGSPSCERPGGETLPVNSDLTGTKTLWHGRLTNGVSPMSAPGKAVPTPSEDAKGGSQGGGTNESTEKLNIAWIFQSHE